MDTNGELARRISSLERANHRLAALLAALAVGVCLAFALGAGTARTETLEARRLVLRDREGRIRVELGTEPTGSCLSLLDDRGRRRIRLRAMNDGTAVLRIEAGTLAEDTRRVVDLKVPPDGWSSLTFADARGTERLALGLGYDGEPRLRMYTENGGSRVVLGSDRSGRADLVIHDEAGAQRAVVRSAPGGAASLELLGGDGITTFIAPPPAPTGAGGAADGRDGP
jgi:hypothetical protein